MRRITNYIIILLSTVFIVTGASGQKVEYINTPELENILKNPDDKLFVVHLWATWCAPCIRELPNFEKTASAYDPIKVRFILISLDYRNQVEKQLIPFLKKNKITLDVAVMVDTDYNSWIDKIDPDWQGEIPATLIFNNRGKKRYFHSGEITEAELKKNIERFLNS